MLQLIAQENRSISTGGRRGLPYPGAFRLCEIRKILKLSVRSLVQGHSGKFASKRHPAGRALEEARFRASFRPSPSSINGDTLLGSLHSTLYGVASGANFFLIALDAQLV